MLPPLDHGAEELGQKPFLGHADFGESLRDRAEHAVVLANER